MESNTLTDPSRVSTSTRILKPWSRWSWKTRSTETPEQPTIDSSLNADINSTLESSPAILKLHLGSISSENIESTFLESLKQDAGFSYDGYYSPSSDEDIFFDFTDDMSTQTCDTSSESSYSQPPTPGKSNEFQFSVAPEILVSDVDGEFSLLFEDTTAVNLELKSERPSITSTTAITIETEDNKEKNEEYTIEGSGLNYPELSPRNFALEKRRILIQRLISRRKDKIGESIQEPHFGLLGSAFTGWSVFPEYSKRS